AKPVTKKVKASPTTIHQVVGESLVTSAPLDSAMRRLARGRGVVARRLKTADPTFTHERLVEDINSGKVTAAPPKDIPAGLPSDEAVTSGAGASGPTPAWVSFIKRYLWLLLLVLLVLALIFAISGLWIAVVVCVAVAAGVFAISRRPVVRGDVAPGFTDPSTVPAALAELP